MSSADVYRSLPSESFRGFGTKPKKSKNEPPKPPSLHKSNSFDTLVDGDDDAKSFKPHVIRSDDELPDQDPKDLEEEIGDNVRLLHLPTLVKQESSKPEQSESDPYLITLSTSSPLHPFNFSKVKKWTIIALICSAAMCVTATSSIEATAVEGIQKGLGATYEAAMAGLSLFVIGMGAGGVLFGPLSEFLGRRWIYLISFSLFFLGNIPIAFAQNVGSFLVFRFLTGFVGSAFLSVAGGSVTDMFPPGTSDVPIGVYTLSPLIGPAVGPLIGGFINQNILWRVTFYTVSIWAFVEVVLLYFFCPETFLPIILRNMAADKRLETKNEKYYAPMERSDRTFGTVLPQAIKLGAQIMVTEKMAFAINIWISLVLGIIYLMFSAVPFIFREVYNFDLQSQGLSFIPLGLGMILATLTVPFWARRVSDAAVRNGGRAPPEARLPVGMAGAIICPIALLWTALSSYTKVTWLMPMFGTLLFGIGAYYVFLCGFGFLIATYTKNAASAMAGNTFMRCIFAGAFPFFSLQLYQKLGSVGGTGLLTGILALFLPIPFVIYRKGPELRKTSKFAEA